MDMIPGWKPMTEAELHKELKGHFDDANDENIQEYIEIVNKAAEVMKKDVGMRVIGVRRLYFRLVLWRICALYPLIRPFTAQAPTGRLELVLRPHSQL